MHLTRGYFRGRDSYIPMIDFFANSVVDVFSSAEKWVAPYSPIMMGFFLAYRL